MKYCTVINCMDGRVQLPAIRYLQKRFNVDYVDTITEAGPNLILSKQMNLQVIKSILDRLEISISNHHSVGVAIVGHHDCAGNPAIKVEQIKHLQKATQLLRKKYEGIEVIGLWVNDKWEIQEVNENYTSS